MASDRYLFVKHSVNWNVDRCTRWMLQHGKTVDWCYPVDEDPFPDPAAYAGVVVFGGANSANDCSSHDWVRRELRFIESCLKHDTAYLGICLGAQMMARVLGATVQPHPEAVSEVGFSRVDPVPEQDTFLDQPLRVMQWHSEGFDLPPGAVRIATGESFPNQAYRVEEHIYGLQFHPEVNSEVLAIWHERNRKRSSGVLTEQERESMMADAHRHDHQISRWLDGFMRRWTCVCEQRCFETPADQQ